MQGLWCQGGEEYTVIMPGTEMNWAAHVAELIRNAVQQLRIPNSQSSANRDVSISAGISFLIPSGEDVPGKLLELSDKALYKTKRQGGNRICPSTGMIAIHFIGDGAMIIPQKGI